MLKPRQAYKGLLLSVKLHPYVVFLPTEEKDKILSAIFGSKAGVDVLRFSLKQGISKNIYQKDLVKKLNYSNKTIIENLKTLTKLGVLNEGMEKNEKRRKNHLGQSLPAHGPWQMVRAAAGGRKRIIGERKSRNPTEPVQNLRKNGQRLSRRTRHKQENARRNLQGRNE